MRLFFLWTFSLILGATGGSAKGLDTLSAQNPANPENQTESNENSTATGEAKEGEQPASTDENANAQEMEKEAPPPPPSEFSKSISGKIFLQTSYGRVVATKSEGDWKSSGMSDLTIGYKLPFMVMEGLDLFGIFRYAPFDVSAEVDNYSYRGIVEGYNIGALAHYGLSEGIDLTGSLELGYLLVYLDSVDELDPSDVPDDNGVMGSLGFGADFAINEKLAAGPKLGVGFGSFTVFQISGGVTLLF